MLYTVQHLTKKNNIMKITSIIIVGLLFGLQAFSQTRSLPSSHKNYAISTNKETQLEKASSSGTSISAEEQQLVQDLHSINPATDDALICFLVRKIEDMSEEEKIEAAKKFVKFFYNGMDLRTRCFRDFTGSRKVLLGSMLMDSFWKELKNSGVPGDIDFMKNEINKLSSNCGDSSVPNSVCHGGYLKIGSFQEKVREQHVVGNALLEAFNNIL
jgi:hypothetical protein